MPWEKRHGRNLVEWIPEYIPSPHRAVVVNAKTSKLTCVAAQRIQEHAHNAHHTRIIHAFRV